jgi:hypothetical protein
MQVVVLAAGQGTRMRPLTDRRPKPMLPVADRPLCAHTADAAVEAGADELLFVVGYEAEAVRERPDLGDGAVFDPAEPHVRDIERVAGGCEIHERLLMGAGDRSSDGDPVVGRDDVLDRDLDVRGRQHLPAECDHPTGRWFVAEDEGVIDDVLSDERVAGIGISPLDDVGQESSDQRLVFLLGRFHVPSPPVVRTPRIGNVRGDSVFSRGVNKCNLYYIIVG